MDHSLVFICFGHTELDSDEVNKKAFKGRMLYLFVAVLGKTRGSRIFSQMETLLIVCGDTYRPLIHVLQRKPVAVTMENFY